MGTMNKTQTKLYFDPDIQKWFQAESTRLKCSVSEVARRLALAEMTRQEERGKPILKFEVTGPSLKQEDRRMACHPDTSTLKTKDEWARQFVLVLSQFFKLEMWHFLEIPKEDWGKYAKALAYWCQKGPPAKYSNYISGTPPPPELGTLPPLPTDEEMAALEG